MTKDFVLGQGYIWFLAKFGYNQVGLAKTPNGYLGNEAVQLAYDGHGAWEEGDLIWRPRKARKSKKKA